MPSPPTTIEESNRPQTGGEMAGGWFGRICLWLATAVVTAWAVSRVKPVIWYGGLFGLIMVVVGMAWRMVFPSPGRGSFAAELGGLAMLGTAGSLWLGELRIEAQRKTPRDSAAGALMARLEQMAPESTSLSGNSAETSLSEFARFLERRYPAADWRWPWLGAGVELALAGGLAVGTTWLVSRRPSLRSEESAA